MCCLLELTQLPPFVTLLLMWQAALNAPLEKSETAPADEVRGLPARALRGGLERLPRVGHSVLGARDEGLRRRHALHLHLGCTERVLVVFRVSASEVAGSCGARWDVRNFITRFN